MRTQEAILNDIKIIEQNCMSVCIFGAGKIGTGFGREILRRIEIKVDYYCDSNPEKWGKEIEVGIFCISPEELSEKKDCVCFVLLGQRYGQEAVKQVTGLGLEYIVSYDELCSLDMVINAFLDEPYKKNIPSLVLQKEEILNENINNKEYQIANPKGKKIAIYTCISGNYDDVVEPEVISKECDYYLISDNKPKNLKVFQWIDINKVVPEWVKDHTRKNRYCKINVAKIFASYLYSIYIDGNVKIVADITEYVKKIGSSGFGSHKHAYNQCLYSEALKVLAFKRDDESIIRYQMEKYKNEGMPRNYGQFQNGILVRENNNPIMRKLMDDWWREVFTKSYRDQLSLTYCLWKNGLSVSDVGVLGPNMRRNPDFRWMSIHI